MMSDPCPICGGSGYLMKNVPYGHPDFGRLYLCQCLKSELSSRRARQLLEISGLVGTLLDKSFTTYRPRRAAQSQALDRARRYASDPHGWLVFSGSNGGGKTHLAAAIANARLAAHQPVLFVVVPDLLDHLRSTYHPQAPVTFDRRFEQVRSHPLLILDDLGAQSSTDWASEKLFQIINHRYNLELSTVYTTNLRVRDLPIRLRARIGDTKLSTIVNIDIAERQPAQPAIHPSRAQRF